MSDDVKENLKVIENILKTHGLIDPKEKGNRVNAKMKWLYLIDTLLTRPYIWENMEENEIEPSHKLDYLAYYLHINKEGNINYNERLYKAKICLKIIEAFNYHEIIDETRFPKELEFDPRDDEPYDNKSFFLKLSNPAIPYLLEFSSIYYKLQLFNEMFICPILAMLKYTNINCYEDVKKKFEEFDFDLIDLALSKINNKIKHDSGLEWYTKEKIYWIKSIAYMYRIPIPVEPMLLVDDNSDFLYNRLNRLEDEKYFGSPDYNDKHK